MSVGRGQPRSWILHLHGRVNKVTNDFFHSLGYWVATNSASTLALSFVFVLACSFGFANFKVDFSEEIWMPENSLSKKHEAVARENFDSEAQYGSIVFEDRKDRNLLTKATFDTVWDIHHKVLELETADGARYEELCMKTPDGEGCQPPWRGVTLLWADNFSLYQNEIQDDTSLLAYINRGTSSGGTPVNFNSIFGNSISHVNETITAASAMCQTYTLTTNEDLEDDVMEWQTEFINLMEEEKGRHKNRFNLTYLAGRSYMDALQESISGEIHLVATTYGIMIFFVMMVIGRCFNEKAPNRSWISVGGVFLILGSGIAAYGINSAFGIPFTVLSQVLPFILIGIGVDDMFVIMASLDHTDSTLRAAERVALALQRCGVSITYTSLTDFLAFMLGSMTRLPAVRYFCYYAATAILFDFILQVTAFPAMVAIDVRRQEAGAMDWCCCCSRKRTATQVVPLSNVRQSAFPATVAIDERREEAGAMGWCCCCWRKRGATQVVPLSNIRQSSFQQIRGMGNSARNRKKFSRTCCRPPPEISLEHPRQGESVPAESDESGKDKLSGLGRLMRDTYAPNLLSVPGKIVVLVFTGVLLATGIYGSMQVSQRFDLLDLSPRHHYARHYQRTARAYEIEIDTQFLPLRTFTLDVDYSNTTVQAEILAIEDQLLGLDFVEGPIVSWLRAFIASMATASESSMRVAHETGISTMSSYPELFYDAVRTFILEEENARFEQDIIFAEDGTIKISRTQTFLMGQNSTSNLVSSIKQVRGVYSDSDLYPDTFTFSRIFVFAEQFLIIYRELITNFLLVLVAVGILSITVLGQLTVTLLVCFTVFVIDIELMGFVEHWGLHINSITVVVLVMAVGLVVDYVVHIVHYALHQDPPSSGDQKANPDGQGSKPLGDKERQIANALGEIGPSVVLGASTTLLGVLPTALGNNYVFEVFFKMFLVIIALGIYHGVVFVPVALSLLPGNSLGRRRSSEKSDSEEKEARN